MRLFNMDTSDISISKLTILLCILACFVGIVDHDLWPPDETRVAAISLEMSRSHDFVVPHLAKEPFVEKPPLYFALGAISIQTLGKLLGNIGAVRLTSAIWGIGTLFMIFLITKRLFSRETGVIAACMLAVMLGFINNSHWIRVDAALMFCVAASTWCFVEVFFAENKQFYLPAGILLGCTFLSKGLIGITFVAMGWIGMVIPWFLNNRNDKAKIIRCALYHLLTLLAFVTVIGIWIFLLWKEGGDELFHAWFWDNQVGRLTGSSTQLGHMRHAHDYIFYIKIIASQCLPWSLLIILFFRKFFEKDDSKFSAARIFLTTMFLGSLALLSASATKRSLYLDPLLPIAAIICAETASRVRKCKFFFLFWMALCVIIIAGLAIITSTVPLLGSLLPEHINTLLTPLKWWHAFMAIIATSVGIYLLSPRYDASFYSRFISITALCYITAMLTLAGVINSEKSMRPRFESFVKQIPTSERSKAVGWMLSETMRGGLYFYQNWSLAVTTNADRIKNVLAGDDKEFNSVLYAASLKKSALPDIPFTVMATENLGRPGGKKKRAIQWIRGSERKNQKKENNK